MKTIKLIISRVKANPRLAAFTLTADALTITVVILFIQALQK